VKTISLKKVAAIAVASLVFGGISSVPAFADAGDATAISVAKTSENPSGTALAVGKYTAAPVLDALQVSSITVTAGTTVKILVTAVGGDFTVDDDIKVAMRGFGTVSDWAAADVTAAGAESNNNSFTATSVPGTYTLDVTLRKAGASDVTTDLTASITMVVVAGATWSQGASTILGAATVVPGTTTTDADSRTGAKANGTYLGTVTVTLKGTTGAAYTGQTVVGTMSGSGFVGCGSWDDAGGDADGNIDNNEYGAENATTTRTATVTDTTGVVICNVWADGTSGVGTLSVSVTDQVSSATTVMGTKSFTAYGSVTKLAVVESVYTIGRAGGATTGAADADLDDRTAAHIPAVVVKTTDSSNTAANAVAVPTVVSDNLLVATGGTCALDDNATAYSSGGSGFYNCNFVTAATAKSGDKATLTIRIVNPADATTYLSATYAITVGGSVAKEVMTTNKTTFAPGEAMTITVTATDSSGNPVYDGAATIAAVVASKSAIGLPAAASVYVGGKKTFGSLGGVYAPSLAGAFSLTATGTDVAATTISASASVTDANAGLLTQIDALNAKIVALNALIAKIMKKLGVK